MVIDQKYKFRVHTLEQVADIHTPVSIYLKLREEFPQVHLLESCDYRGNENSISYICAGRLARYSLKDFNLSLEYPDKSAEETVISDKDTALCLLQKFHGQFSFDNITSSAMLFGYTGYSAVKYFENIKIEDNKDDIPDMVYDLFEYVIEFQHFSNRIKIFHNSLAETCENKSDFIRRIIQNGRTTISPFILQGSEKSNLTDKEHLELIQKCKTHVFRGDVFQMVFSRQFSQEFDGDDFQVYRTLRSINPSPFLFYFDYGSYKLFGSSPEVQIKVDSGKAYIRPIAGTFRRGEGLSDDELAAKLTNDPKENSEHIMLVDLARNDLSRHCSEVKVEKLRNIEFYSHVVHLVSSVSGILEDKDSALKVFGDTFPAGTLSGAPKYKAMELINNYEVTPRSFYGGAIGAFAQNGNIIHAILIRTFLSKNKKLFFQAGSGVVADSELQMEVDEVKNKLLALRRAIKEAGVI